MLGPLFVLLKFGQAIVDPLLRRRLVVFACRLCLAISLAVLIGRPSAAQGVFHQDFEEPGPSWKPAASDTKYRIAIHERTQQIAHGGNRSELVRVVGSNGSYVYMTHAIDAARVISELAASVWIRADRPGVQCFVRVVFPRTRDPRTGYAATALLRGSIYTNVGSWQQLRVDNLPQLISRQARVLRAQFGAGVDPREAYIDQFMLNVFGGPGATTVWIDDLEIGGIIGPSISNGQPFGPLTPDRGPRVQNISVASDPERLPATATEKRSRVRLQGTQLQVDGRTVFPRVVQHRQEPLQHLQQLGFNVVRLEHVPDFSLLEEAQRLGLWLIAPPPSEAELAKEAISQAFSQVIAWDLGDSLNGEQLETTRRWARLVRDRDPERGRPLLAAPQSDLRAYGRIADILLIGGQPLGSSLELDEYAEWTKSLPRLARPGTPIWIRVQTDFDPAMRRQWAAFASGRSPLPGAIDSQPARLAPAGADDWQIRLLVRSAVVNGARGVVFDSHTSLAAPDENTRRRQLALALTNMELDLIEPWASRGSFITNVTTSGSDMVAAALQTERARLLLPIRFAPGSQYAPQHPNATTRWFVVPGIPESNDAYQLTPAGLQPMRHKRVTGGVRVWQDRFSGDAVVALTGDPRVVSGLTQRIGQVRRRGAEWNRELATRKMQWIQGIERELDGTGEDDDSHREWLAQAAASVTQCDTYLAAGDYRRAYEQAQLALDLLGRITRARWQQFTLSWPSPVASPMAVNFATLPDHLSFATELQLSRAGVNLLPDGDFENLDDVLAAGWQHFQHPRKGLESDVQLSPAQPHSGRFCLKLRAWAENPQERPAIIESAPLWITSAPVRVEAGQRVRIHGWVRVPRKIAGSVDGLLVFDSFGGRALAHRIDFTNGWQEFTLYRAAPESVPLTVTFALSGLGEANLDGVTIQLLDRGGGATERPARIFSPPRLR